jgi:outer membrane protein assembly factor BamB
VVYIGDGDGRFYAIRESDQTVLWSRFLGIVTSTTCPGNLGLYSTATVANAPGGGPLAVYENSPDGNVYALDAATGAVDWKSELDDPSSTQNDYFAWGSPVIANGKLYVGIASDCDVPLVDGGVASFNQSTGAPIARWHAMLSGRPGGSVWSTPAVLPDGSVIATTGNDDTTVQTPWAEAIVRLDGSTLSELDGWEVPPAPGAGDSDFGSSPTLFTATIGGVATPMVGACNKNGNYYAFKQLDLHDGPVWTVDLATPPSSGAGRCVASAIWNGSQLILAGGDNTTIGGVTYAGSLQSVDPATGAVLWAAGLPGAVVGSPTEDGAGLIAAPTFSGSDGVYLVRASDGAVVGTLPSPGAMFAQPVFANGDLLAAAGSPFGLTAFEEVPPGPAITSVSPAVMSPGQSVPMTVTGSGFSGSPTVMISGLGLTTSSIHVVDATELTFTVKALVGSALGPRNLTVIEPGTSADSCTNCLSVLPATTTSVASSANPSTFAAAVTFVATVNPTDNGGSVAFSADGSTIAGCGAQPLGAGQATCTVSTLAIRTHAISATYSGDSAYAGSSALLAGGQVVQAPPSPAPPVGLQASVVSTTSLALVWTASPGATKYLVLRGTQTGGPYTQVGTVTTTAKIVTGLTPATAYYFVVEASAGFAYSGASNEATAATPAVPAAPTNVTAKAISTTSVALAWDAVPGATKYSVYRWQGDEGSESAVLAATVTATKRTLSGLDPGTTYHFDVKAVSAYATSQASAIVSALTMPATPANLHVTSTKATSIALSWNASQGATRYAVYESTTPGGPWTLVASPTATAKTVNGLAPGTTYYFTVKAQNASGASPLAAQVSSTTT